MKNRLHYVKIYNSVFKIYGGKSDLCLYLQNRVITLKRFDEANLPIKRGFAGLKYMPMFKDFFKRLGPGPGYLAQAITTTEHMLL